ncbi:MULTISPECIES: phage tail tape measure protein [unclassified Shinella]|uniref:phage tail tape measure protein n=1 Tax=unclassified Shinella TaxID=2643062 RepID=UPI00225C6865|nr:MULTISPECIES: phage tail tape measure protein [unclassified Shinella]MCO5138984.1 phage tail tape measure protein [Shinella sp.]MDC7256287.1 phage tail tape measure protein [Shinella sp. YE25]CAI0339145.1 PhageMin_Tail domain-containing protein [Rhizobiaceae bacterium]CAK7257560.1 Phage tail tape measure protein domain-containing protein [Shinella sp. WSC3-e]
MKASVIIEFLAKGLDKAKASERSLRDLGRAADGAEREASGLARANERLGNSSGRIIANEQRATHAIHRSTEAMRRQKVEAMALERQTDRLARSQRQHAAASSMVVAGGGLAGMRGVGAAFIGGLGLGVGGAAGAGLIAKESLQLAAAIEYERDQLQVLGEYSDEKAALYDKILKPAGVRRGVGTKGAYGVFGELMAGGLGGDDAAAMTDDVLTFAKATRAETTDAGKTAVALQNNMKVSAGEMMQAFDAMALAGKEGQFEVRDMARNAPSIFAKMAKLGEQGLSGVRGFAAMAQAIRSTAGTSDEAATNFENMLDKFTSGDFIKNAKKMGINVEKVFSDANKKGVSPVLEILKKIRDVTKGDTFKLKELMPDVQANAALSALIGQIPQLEAAIGRYGNAGGTVMRDFKNATDNATEAWNRLSSNIADKAERIAGTFLPKITEAMNGVSQAMEDGDARREGVGKVSNGDRRIEKNTRDEFFKRYQAELEKDGVGMPKRYALTGKAWDAALTKYGKGEIGTIFDPVNDLEQQRRARELYQSGKSRTSVGRHSGFLGITRGGLPTPDWRADNLPAEPGSARWLADRYGKGTGRESIGSSSATMEAEREKKRPPLWKRFLFGAAADPDFDHRENFGIKLRPGGQKAGDDLAKGMEQGGKKAEQAIEATARQIESTVNAIATFAAGLKVGEQFAAGLRAAAPTVAAAASAALVAPVADRVPQSPAKIGPLRNLPLMGRKIAQQLAGGMRSEQSPMRAAQDIAGRIASASAGSATAAGSAQLAGAAAGRSLSIGQIVLNGVKDAADGVNQLGAELERRWAGMLADGA